MRRTPSAAVRNSIGLIVVSPVALALMGVTRLSDSRNRSAGTQGSCPRKHPPVWDDRAHVGRDVEPEVPH